ncbi:inner-membrane translocator [Streptomyces collinus]|uniref:inner-membrane translocator n=1 Tax=Streptomyces collinus TaxID=42684 RepID=UPI0036CE95C3
MTEPADKHHPNGADAFTAGCLLLLVLVADVAAGLLVFIVLAARGLRRTDAGSPPAVADSPPADWTQVLGFGVLALAVGVTGLALLRLGHRGIGAVQLALCVVVAAHALTIRPL